MQDTAEKLKEQLKGMQTFQSYQNKISAAQEEQRYLQKEVAAMEKACQKENHDVESLEKGGLQAFYFKVRGKYEERMDKEVLEAAAAKVKLENKKYELTDVERRLNELRIESSKYVHCEFAYKQLYQQRLDEILLEENPQKVKILELQTRISSLEHNLKELNEAVTAGRVVLRELENVQGSLDSASGWGTWDMLGGGLITDMMKHSDLDEAKEKLENVQRLMGSFRTELADVDMVLDIQIHTDGFSKFADFFFDGLFADINMQNRIDEAKASVGSAKSNVESIISKLNMQSLKEKESIADLEDQISEIVNG